ncbi:beta-lactamase family protein [Antrihabitans cavernicola]|uniref:Beta-lactamase family protein n=2 Tax=Antrihabitans cavernicola TaxID=2495913 RepID=A0A5A7S3N7_9NOCA|nr:beta-lactamase family protein [Spelaeibacter cavernicola]
MLVESDYLPLADQFFSMYREPGQGGAALAVYQDGEPVVDIWAGWADRDKRWNRNSVAMAFSTGKGVASTVLHRIAERGLIDYDLPVATYWPEFAQAGKADITVRDVLTHRAGLHRAKGLVPGSAGILDYDRVIAALEACPADPRRLRTSGYHAITFGWLVAEIVHRVTGTPFIDVLRTEIADVLGEDEFWYVVPEGRRDRIAKIFPHINPPGIKWGIASSVISLVRPVRGLAEAGMPEGFDKLVRDPRVHESVMPGWNGVFSARALAKMYGALANNGEVDGRTLLKPETIEQIGTRQVAGHYDYVLGYPVSFTLGYHRPVLMAKSQPHKAFGHYGMGGSGAYADPETGMSLAFVTNRLGGSLTALGDLRLARLGATARAITTRQDQ